LLFEELNEGVTDRPCKGDAAGCLDMLLDASKEAGRTVVGVLVGIAAVGLFEELKEGVTERPGSAFELGLEID
jgi:hypothetical protein